MTGIRAWLITWEGYGGERPGESFFEGRFHPHVIAEHQVVAVLSADLATETVRAFTESVYRAHAFTAAEQISQAAGGHKPYPAEVQGPSWIMCGHNPWLEARIVENLHPIGEEAFGWDEPLADGSSSKPTQGHQPGPREWVG